MTLKRKKIKETPVNVIVEGTRNLSLDKVKERIKSATGEDLEFSINNASFSTPATLSHFTLTPSQNGNWTTTFVSDEGATIENTKDDQPFNILFEVNPDEPTYLNRFQRATLVVKINNLSDTEFWQFHGDGVVYTEDTSELNCRVQTEVVDNNTTLIITIDQVKSDMPDADGDNAYCIIPFRYAATCIDLSKPLEPGETSIYYSQDPSIGVGGAIPP